MSFLLKLNDRLIDGRQYPRICGLSSVRNMFVNNISLRLTRLLNWATDFYDITIRNLGSELSTIFQGLRTGYGFGLKDYTIK